MTQQETYAAYQAARRADLAFQSQVMRQFGAAKASHMRYIPDSFDARTQAAYDAFVDAMDACRAAFRARNIHQPKPKFWTRAPDRGRAVRSY